MTPQVLDYPPNPREGGGGGGTPSDGLQYTDTGRLHLKGVPFSCFRYMKGYKGISLVEVYIKG